MAPRKGWRRGIRGIHEFRGGGLPGRRPHPLSCGGTEWER